MTYPDVQYCINLDRSQERWNYTLNVTRNFKLNRWAGVEKEDIWKFAEECGLTVENRLSRGKMGCYLAHYLLWRHLYEKGYEKVWIMEDDQYFVPNWQKDLIDAPEVDYDIVYLCSWRNELPLDNSQPDKEDIHVGGKLYEVQKASSNLSYFVSRKALEVLLEDLKVVRNHQDLQMRDECFHKLKTYSFYPNLVHQSGQLVSISNQIDVE